MEETEEFMSRDTFELVGQIVSVNVDSAAKAYDRLEESYKAQLETLSQAYIDLFEAVDRAAEIVTTRHLERALHISLVHLDTAYSILEKESY